MNILYLLSQRPEMTGSGVYVTELMRCAVQYGLNTALLAGTPCDCGVPEEVHGVSRLLAEVRFGRDLPFPVTGMSDVMPYPSSRWSDLSREQLDDYVTVFARELKRMVEVFRPDVIHANHLWLLTSIARDLFPHIPVIASCHGSDLRQFVNLPHLAERIRPNCQRLDAVLALSAAQARTIEELYAIPVDRIHVVGAGYSSAVFHETPASGRDSVRILYAGKLSRAKGVPWLLRACKELDVPFRLDLCGGGSGEDAALCRTLADQVNERFGADVVTLHGNVSQRGRAELMRQAAVFVLPSFFEGVPLVLLEALACGCRLVATDLPGVREVFSDASSGLIRMVPLPRLLHADEPVQEDEEAFCRRLKEALHAQLAPAVSPEVLRTERASLLRDASWDAVFKRTLAVYRLVDRNGTAAIDIPIIAD